VNRSKLSKDQGQAVEHVKSMIVTLIEKSVPVELISGGLLEVWLSYEGVIGKIPKDNIKMCLPKLVTTPGNIIIQLTKLLEKFPNPIYSPSDMQRFSQIDQLRKLFLQEENTTEYANHKDLAHKIKEKILTCCMLLQAEQIKANDIAFALFYLWVRMCTLRDDKLQDFYAKLDYYCISVLKKVRRSLIEKLFIANLID
jgi:hypothetical protein